MSVITVGAAQLGPIARSESRAAVVKRLIGHLQEARARGCDLVVFPIARTRRRCSTSPATAAPSTTA